MNNTTPASLGSPISSPSKNNSNKVRILWRGSFLLQDGVQLPGLSIISTHSPAAAGSQNQRHTRKPTADVFGALPLTPSNDLASPVLEHSQTPQACSDQDDRIGMESQDDAESDLTLSIEMLRHAPLNLHTHDPLPALFKSAKKGKGKDVAEVESELERDWIVSSSTSLSLDSAHWSTIDYLHRSLLTPPPSSSTSAGSSSPSFPPKMVRLTISPPQQDEFASSSRLDKGKSRLLQPAAPFDVFATPPTEFAIVPVPVLSEEKGHSPSENAAVNSDTLNANKKRARSTAAPTSQLLRLAIAQRRPPPPAPSPTLPGTSGARPTGTSSTPNGAPQEGTPAKGISTERGLSATKKRMAVAAAARSRTLTSSSSTSSILGSALGPSAPTSVHTKRPRLSGGGAIGDDARFDSASQLSNGRTRSVPNLARARSENADIFEESASQHAQEGSNASQQPVTSSTSTVTRASVRQQIKKLTRYALLARGMVESSKGATATATGASTGKTTATSDEYVAVLRAVASAAETALKPELDALTPAGTAPSHAATAAAAAAAASLQDLPRLAACVQAFVQLYAPPLPRAATLPPPQ
ncbi:hypothetical protein OC846_002873 [Tilletia horrida]|uniref:Sld7 C-terminal domain-containing protein n=1 Tax=Tilletia horrida TaxID=155126 RepID=A0AAN6GTJ2_9BASI|nr:hypothetical protein OC846_002873 [Tilletia horrida]